MSYCRAVCYFLELIRAELSYVFCSKKYAHLNKTKKSSSRHIGNWYWSSFSGLFFLTFADFKLTSLPAFFACIALVARVVASLAPAAPGIPIWTNASVSLPTALSSAISSKGFNLSKNSGRYSKC